MQGWQPCHESTYLSILQVKGQSSRFPSSFVIGVFVCLDVMLTSRYSCLGFYFAGDIMLWVCSNL